MADLIGTLIGLACVAFTIGLIYFTITEGNKNK